MFSFLASSIPRTDISSTEELRFEDGRSGLTFLAPSDPHLMSLKLPPLPFPTINNTLVSPPLHWHIHQTEHFLVTSGLMLGTVDSQTTTLKEGETLTVNAGQYHKFSNASKTEILEVRVGMDPENRANDEAFFRNVHMYLEDARKHGKRPSPFQLTLMMHTAGSIIALPGPKVVSKPASRLLMWVLGSLIGKRLLGYKACYPEYYNPPTK